ncbi:MAG: sulfatase [Actinomycetota bacterium]|nr:sulfatase [Actinomycetota bacterium]
MRILYIDVDTLRPDHLRAYGYHRDTAPNLDRLVQRSVVFDRYYCADSPCLPSRAALTSGQFGITNGVIGHFGRAAAFRLDAGHFPPPDRPLLGQRLQQHGWYTAAISMFAERHRAYWFCGNYREIVRATGELNDEQAHDINPVAIDWIRRHRDQDNWFLHLHYWEPHTDYLVGPEWVERAGQLGPPPDWPDGEAIAAHAEVYGPRTALDLHYLLGPRPSAVPHAMPDAIRDRDDVELLMNGYDATILYWDHYVGQLLDTLDELGIADDTAIIVSGDHGESLGENGSYAEHGLANEPTLWVPLIVFWPGVTDALPEASRRRSELLYNIDFAPTLCDLLGIDPPAGWQGASFAPALRGEPVDRRDALVLGQGAHTYQRAVRTDDHLYIRTYHPGSMRTPWEQLYDVTADPHLTRDLLDERPELAAELRDHLATWWHRLAGRPGAPPDPMLTTLQTGPTYYTDPRRYQEHLRSTGRAHFADELRGRLEAVSGTPSVWWESPERATLFR